MAGKRKGKEDERHLWPEMLRAIREISPRWVVGENVRGLTNWNGGLVFDEVQADLEALGYEVTPFLLPACGVNAPHRRDRIWFIAYSDSAGFQTKRSEQQTARIEQYGELHTTTSNPHSSTTRTPGQSDSAESDRSGNNDEPKQRRSKTELNYRPFAVLRPIANTESFRAGGLRYQSRTKRTCNCNELSGVECGISNENATNTSSEQLQRSKQHGGIGSEREIKANVRQFSRPICSQWQNFPTQPPICSGDDELPSELDGITFSKWRSESIKAFGNAVVPELVYQIFKSINAYEEL